MTKRNKNTKAVIQITVTSRNFNLSVIESLLSVLYTDSDYNLKHYYNRCNSYSKGYELNGGGEVSAKTLCLSLMDKIERKIGLKVVLMKKENGTTYTIV